MPALVLLKLVGGRILSFLGSLSLWQALCLGLALFGGLQTIRLHGEQRHSAKVEAQLAKVVEAQKVAAQKNQAEVKAKEAESKRISDETKSAYQRDLARLRAERLRQNIKGAADKPGVSQTSPTAGRTDADGLQVPPACDVPEEAAEIELRLMHLQNWVEEQRAAQGTEAR